ncbi:MAG: HAMP domain-containing histidine kinase, partial [Chloroflexi bacterium]|nr:HAMP domain-containing histidine kinase [Chloroflexota bacterium]
MKARLTFRGRLLIGHILPVLLLVPLVGLALIYLLETRLILPTLANEMIDQGILVERLTRDQPGLWTSPAGAQALLDSVDFRRPSRIGLLTPGHVLLATSRPDDRSLVGETIAHLPDTGGLTTPWWGITPGDQAGEQILDVVLPVREADGRLVGLVRIYRRITDIEQNFASLRLLVLAVLLFGLLVSGSTAVLLSESVSRPLKTITQAIAAAPLEGHAPPLPEVGDDQFSALARAYNRLQARREDLEDTRRQMLANVVHEIGRPLGSLRTALHALQAGAVQDRPLRTDLMKGMAERIDRMGRLLEDMALTYRGLEPQEIHVQAVALAEWLEPLLPLWAESARQKALDWEAQLPEEMPVLRTDPDRLAQVIGNLVNNAIKFTPRGGQVRFGVALSAEGVDLWVSDTGIGIPAEDQRHLFVPFYRSVQPSWKAPGLGLGLSIARSITASLGGSLSVHSLPGQGSTFTV